MTPNLESELENEIPLVIKHLLTLWAVIFIYIYFVLYEQIHKDIYFFIKLCFCREPSISLDDYLSDNIITRPRKRARSKSVGNYPDTNYEEFKDTLFKLDDDEQYWFVGNKEL